MPHSLHFKAFVERLFSESLAGRRADALRPRARGRPLPRFFLIGCNPSRRSDNRPASTVEGRLSTGGGKYSTRHSNRLEPDAVPNHALRVAAWESPHRRRKEGWRE